VKSMFNATEVFLALGGLLLTSPPEAPARV
jgi:hypothetical protein